MPGDVTQDDDGLVDRARRGADGQDEALEQQAVEDLFEMEGSPGGECAERSLPNPGTGYDREHPPGVRTDEFQGGPPKDPGKCIVEVENSPVGIEEDDHAWWPGSIRQDRFRN